jgi:hypothetical protein
LRLSVVILWLVLVASAALVAFVGAPAPAPVAAAPTTGMDILRAYKCRRPETKSIIVRGVEDNFSPVGEERGFIRPGRRSQQTLTSSPDPRYDYDQEDHFFSDSLALPPRVASGLLVMGLRPNGDTRTDGVGYGDISSTLPHVRAGRYGSIALSLIPKTPAWQVRGALHSISLADLQISLDGRTAAVPGNQRSLLSLIRVENLPWLDIIVQDDTSVDFIGLAICQEPPRGKGLTVTTAADPPGANLMALSCRFNKDESHICDPHAGDTPCDSTLPVVCLRQEGRGVPAALERNHSRWYWTGGSLALTEPVPASRFARIGDVDRFCASRFGSDWRAASLHDSGNPGGVTGFGDPRTSVGRAWIDILDQPYATCWTR